MPRRSGSWTPETSKMERLVILFDGFQISTVVTNIDAAGILHLSQP